MFLYDFELVRVNMNVGDGCMFWLYVRLNWVIVIIVFIVIFIVIWWFFVIIGINSFCYVLF